MIAFLLMIVLQVVRFLNIDESRQRQNLSIFLPQQFARITKCLKHADVPTPTAAIQSQKKNAKIVNRIAIVRKDLSGTGNLSVYLRMNVKFARIPTNILSHAENFVRELVKILSLRIARGMFVFPVAFVTMDLFEDIMILVCQFRNVSQSFVTNIDTTASVELIYVKQPVIHLTCQIDAKVRVFLDASARKDTF